MLSLWKCHSLETPKLPCISSQFHYPQPGKLTLSSFYLAIGSHGESLWPVIWDHSWSVPLPPLSVTLSLSLPSSCLSLLNTRIIGCISLPSFLWGILWQDLVSSNSAAVCPQVWSTSTCEFVRTLNGHKRGIACLQYRDRLVVSGSSDNTIRCVEIDIGLFIYYKKTISRKQNWKGLFLQN